MEVLAHCKSESRLAPTDNRRASIVMRLVTKGGEFLRAGEPQRALAAYRHARDILDGLSGSENDNADLGLTLSLVYRKIGDAMRAQDDMGGAQEAYRSSLAILEGLANFHPDNAELYSTIGRRRLLPSRRRAMRLGRGLTMSRVWRRPSLLCMRR